MLLTRIWGVILACLATFFLAGMFLVAAGGEDDFAPSDEIAVRAVADAGVAALEAQIARHPVATSRSVLSDPRVRALVDAAREGDQPDDAVAPGEPTLGEVITELTEELRERTGDASITVALLDTKNTVKAVNGAAAAELPLALSNETLLEVAPDTHALFSLMLEDKLYVARVSEADQHGNRILALGKLDIGAGSTFRRVLGSSSPAALVRSGKQVGDIIGDQGTDDLETLAKAHISDTPPEGSSKTFRVGEGTDARLGALGRVPGPAGRGKDGVLLAVLSGKTAGARQRDLATALRHALDDNGLANVNFVMLLGLLAVTAGLAVYLPTLEGTSPLARLRQEFAAMAQGSQHSLFHDRYGGPFGELARAANAAHEALRQAYLAELEIDEEELEADPTASRSRTAHTRTRKPTRAHRSAATARRGRTRASEHLGAATLPHGEPAAPAATPAQAQPPEPGPAAQLASASSSGVGIAAPPAVAPAPEMPRRPAGVQTAPVPTTPIEPSGTLVPRPPPAQVVTDPTGTVPPVAPEPPPAAPATSAAEDYYQEVYEEFLQVKQACGESTANFTIDKFSKKLAKQTSDIKRKREGVADVRFTVYVKDGKAALRAKVVRA